MYSNFCVLKFDTTDTTTNVKRGSVIKHVCTQTWHILWNSEINEVSLLTSLHSLVPTACKYNTVTGGKTEVEGIEGKKKIQLLNRNNVGSCVLHVCHVL